MGKKLIFAVAVIIGILLVVTVSLKINKGRPLFGGQAASGLAAKAALLESKGELLAAKAAYQKLISEYSSSNKVGNWQKSLGDINIRIIFSSLVTPKTVIYTVKPGDSLVKIAREFKTTPELIMKSNNMSSEKILVGRKIRVWNPPFSILVDKSQNILILKSDEEIIKIYTVSTGANNCTPAGSFKIVNKLANPTWFKAGAVVEAGSPENILGSRWMGINVPGYGIHGTTQPDKLGQQVTQGCVRMANSDVEELYAIVPEGTSVEIID